MSLEPEIIELGEDDHEPTRLERAQYHPAVILVALVVATWAGVLVARALGI